jgi:hypothetical protein
MTEEEAVVREGMVSRDEARAEALSHATETGLVNPIREVVGPHLWHVLPDPALVRCRGLLIPGIACEPFPAGSQSNRKSIVS